MRLCCFRNNFYGDIVINTSMGGYQEVLTDPSYFNKAVIFSNVNIGNTGLNIYDNESHRVWPRILIIKNLSVFFSSFQYSNDIYSCLRNNKVSVLVSEDIRYLVKYIANNKIKKCSLFFKNKEKINNTFLALKKRTEFKISTNISYCWSESSDCFRNKKYNYIFINKIIVIDFGLKLNILRSFSYRSFFVIVLNDHKGLKNINKIETDGVVLTSGPGYPNKYTFFYNYISSILGVIPLMAICFGHQLLFASLGFEILTLTLGHHGINHPVSFGGNIFYISSQNHEFYVRESGRIVSLIDNTNQGYFSVRNKLVTFQGHPEHCPGPSCLDFLFDSFTSCVR